MINIPWQSPSIIVPVDAIRVLRAFKQYFNHEPLVCCRDCKYVHVEDGAIKRHWCDREDRGKQHSFLCHPNGFCAWGKLRKNPCRNADENAAAFADAPTLKTASQPTQTRTFELGA